MTLADLHRDPFPIFERLRRENSVPFVPAVDRYLVTRYDDVRRVDNDPGTFTANETPSLMKRAMGHSMLRKDNPDHARERASYGGVMKPRAVSTTWTAIFDDVFEECFRKYVEAGTWSRPRLRVRRAVRRREPPTACGFNNATDADMLRWSQTLINGTGNYADDPEVWARAERSFGEVDTALGEMIHHYLENPDEVHSSPTSSTQAMTFPSRRHERTSRCR